MIGLNFNSQAQHQGIVNLINDTASLF